MFSSYLRGCRQRLVASSQGSPSCFYSLCYREGYLYLAASYTAKGNQCGVQGQWGRRVIGWWFLRTMATAGMWVELSP